MWVSNTRENTHTEYKSYLVGFRRCFYLSRVGDYYPPSNTKLATYHLSVVETLLSGQLASIFSRHNNIEQGGVI